MRRFTFLILSLAFFSSISLADVTSAPTALRGCDAKDLAANASGAVVVAACTGPKGLYYSLDFGVSWRFAQGGAYTFGEGEELAMSSTDVFARVGSSGALFKASHASLQGGAPVWQQLPISGATSFLVTDTLIIYGRSDGHVLSTSASGQQVQSTTIQSASTVRSLAFDSSNGILYAVADVQSSRKLFRASFTGGSIGSWSDISSASGLPASANFGKVAASPAGQIYVSTRQGSDDSTSQEFRSGNQGSSFGQTPVTGFSNDAAFSSDGSIAIIGSFFTTDSGGNWTPLARSNASDPSLQSSAVALNPSNPDQAIVRTGLGMARTTALTSSQGSPSFTDSNAGLLSPNVRDVSQVPNRKSQLLVGLTNGVAFASDFTGSAPTFQSYCPLADCQDARVALDPADATNAYSGHTAIYRGTISNGGVNWGSGSFIPALGANLVLTKLEVPASQPSKLFASYVSSTGAESGGLAIYDKDSGDLLSLTLSVPVNTFSVLSANVMIAALGSELQTNPTSSSRGIVITRDGGQTWQAMHDADFSSLLLVSRFAFDSTRDILYAATINTATGSTSNGGVFALKKVLSTTATNWTATSKTFEGSDNGRNNSFDSIAIDPSTGAVYVSAGRQIWVSPNAGARWYLYYTGQVGDTFRALTFDALLGGGPGGLNAFNGEPTTCRSTGIVSRAVRKRISIAGTFVGALTRTPAANSSVTLQRLSGKKWTSLAARRTNAKGKLTFGVRATSGSFRFISSASKVLLCAAKPAKRGR